jgi:hypothetical protein
LKSGNGGNDWGKSDLGNRDLGKNELGKNDLGRLIIYWIPIPNDTDMGLYVALHNGAQKEILVSQ